VHHVAGAGSVLIWIFGIALLVHVVKPIAKSESLGGGIGQINTKLRGMPFADVIVIPEHSEIIKKQLPLLDKRKLRNQRFIVFDHAIWESPSQNECICNHIGEASLRRYGAACVETERRYVLREGPSIGKGVVRYLTPNSTFRAGVFPLLKKPRATVTPAVSEKACVATFSMPTHAL
jgi:hypothetical protein